MKIVTIIGRGNVATHLARALREKRKVTTVDPHTLEGMPSDSDIILISVKDDAIEEVAAKLAVRQFSPDVVVAHTSGSVGIDVLEDLFHNAGVFYPLQTFTKGVPLDYGEIPFFIEGSDRETEASLKELAGEISGKVFVCDSEARRNLHLASVFACNFTNAMAGIAHDILSKSGIDYKVTLPLMRQTIEKLEQLSPSEAQTGPAARGDDQTIGKHLAMLEDRPRLRDIYEKLTAHIKDYGKKI